MHLDHMAGGRGRLTFDLDLSTDRCTYVRGENEAGKTTLLSLLSFAINGPPRDRIPSDTTVSLAWSSPSVRIQRSYRPARGDREETEHSVLVHLNGLKAADKVRSAEQEIGRTIGQAWTWDAGAVFGATPIERRKHLGALVGPAISKTAVLTALRNASVSFQQAGDLQPRLRDAAEAVRRAPEETGGPEAAASWLDGIRAAKTRAQRDAQQLQATLATIDLRLKAAHVPEGSLSALQAQWAAANDRLIELERQRAAANAQRQLRAELEDRHRRAMARATTPVDGIDTAATAMRDAARAAVATCTGRVAETQQLVRDIAEPCDAARAELETVRREVAQLHTLAGAVGVLRELLAGMMSELDDADRHVPGRNERALRELLAQPDAPTEATARLRSAEARADAAGRVKAARERDAAIAVTELANAERSLAASIATVERMRITTNARSADTQAEIHATAQRLAELPTTVGTDQLDAQIEAARSERDTVQLLVEALQTYQALIGDQERTAQLVAQAAHDRQQLHRFEKDAEAAIAALYTTAMAPLVEPASRITQAVLGRPVVLDPLRDWWIGLGSDPVEHVSTSTAAILGVAIRAAVMQLRSGWKALLVDNADAIEDTRRLALIRALSAEPLDTVILCAVDDGVQPPADVARTICLRRPR